MLLKAIHTGVGLGRGLRLVLPPPNLVPSSILNTTASPARTHGHNPLRSMHLASHTCTHIYTHTLAILAHSQTHTHTHTHTHAHSQQPPTQLGRMSTLTLLTHLDTLTSLLKWNVPYVCWTPLCWCCAVWEGCRVRPSPSTGRCGGTTCPALRSSTNWIGWEPTRREPSLRCGESRIYAGGRSMLVPLQCLECSSCAAVSEMC